MKTLIDLYSSFRQIFGICPCCNNFFRLSNCKIYQKGLPENDWMDKIDRQIRLLELQEEKIGLKLQEAKADAIDQGRKQANKIVRQFDKVFTPLKLVADDSKVMFHPVDFVVFKGMNSSINKCIQKLILLDNSKKTNDNLKIQRSVEKTVEKRNYEWITLRILDNGTIKEE